MTALSMMGTLVVKGLKNSKKNLFLKIAPQAFENGDFLNIFFMSQGF